MKMLVFSDQLNVGIFGEKLIHLKSIWAILNRQTHRQTNTRTCRLLDQLGPEGRVGENAMAAKYCHQNHKIGHI